MIEVQLGISYLEDRQLLAVPIDGRVIIVLEDGQPDGNSKDGNGQE